MSSSFPLLHPHCLQLAVELLHLVLLAADLLHLRAHVDGEEKGLPLSEPQLQLLLLPVIHLHLSHLVLFLSHLDLFPHPFLSEMHLQP